MSEKNDVLRLTVLGCRGSIPVSCDRMRQFGGNTSCYLVESGGETLLLDAGTGLPGAPPGTGPVHIVLTHCHFDHVLGLPMFPALFSPEREVHLYGRTRGGLSLREQIARLISPPLWPVAPEAYPARILFHELELPQQIGAFTVDGMETAHPGGSLVLKVSAAGKMLIYATDFDHIGGAGDRLAEFSRGADLLLYDAQYTGEEYAAKTGFGHSTAEAGIVVQRKSGAKQLLLIHHDPAQTDEMLLAREKASGVRFAREGDVIRL